MIVTIAFFLWLISYFKSGRLFNPVGVIAILWLGLLWLSTLSLTGILAPSVQTQWVVLTVIASMVAGSLLAFPKSSIVPNDVVFKNVKVIWILLLVASLPVLWSAVISAKIILNEGYISFLIRTRWGGATGIDAFGSSGVAAVVYNFSRPVIYACFFLGLGLAFQRGTYRLLFASIGLLAVIGILLSERGQILMVVTMLAALIPLGMENRRVVVARSFNRLLVGALFVCAVGITLVMVLTIQRSGGRLNVGEMILHYGLGYHTVGFYLFDQAYSDPNSIMHEVRGFGTATVSILGLVYEQISKLVADERVISIARQLRAEMSVPVYVGTLTFDSGEPYMANAFYTVMFPIYVDFGVLGLVFVPALYGFYLMRIFIGWKYHGDVYSLVLMLFLLWTGYNSLVFPAVGSDYWWLILLALGLLTKVGGSPSIDNSATVAINR